MGLVVVGAAIVGAAMWRSRQASGSVTPELSATAPGVRRLVPEGTRIRVEVLNTTDIRGLGRRATLHLRDAGFDVVRFAGQGPSRDSTLVLDRTGHPAWAELAAEALGGATIDALPDTSRYVDLTVLIGRSWRAPAKPFHP